MGETGICNARRNHAGVLVSMNYGKVTSLHLDPIEKKPLVHFFPGSRILSAGSFGCNLRCHWCQNAGISQARAHHFSELPLTAPEQLAGSVRKRGSIGLAYTYNEPVIWFEYMLETAALIHDMGKKNVMVTNGYINPGPLKRLLTLIDAFNVDLKAFNDDVYRFHTGGRLEAVKNTLKTIALSGKHLEITFLVVPRVNDSLEDFEAMVHWIRSELGREQVLHISRYFPAWHYEQAPTSLELMEKMLKIASGQLDHVYPGNAPYIFKDS